MHRLLQGEVGSGKTIVALRAMLSVVDSSGQAALLAPTEVLAQQHFRTIKKLLGELANHGTLQSSQIGTQVELLTGSMAPAKKKEIHGKLSNGDIGIIIGTHALISDGVSFADLGLVVIDEQHRFGVEQRDALRMKAKYPPHLLVMTATPIPRTVAMTVFGDGLSIDALHIAQESKVAIHFSKDLISKAGDFSYLSEIADEFNEDVFNWILNGGEDHFFIATVDSSITDDALGFPIGRVDVGDGRVFLDGVEIEKGGYQHF